ncbi:Xaa-Pro peptidase family protein [Mesorhizobium sp.]|uniref:M24 family metallopeptidase n=1 Tax=Mesorhizobium sp. TaxID=1871066 RepID=UPI000FE7918F|nr:Xaa-Pro peptidase family protein [Mesorhizobium sp.]RWK76736.1 MAG: M24 family metallopeptidase [Mesorhizobium sp.]RWP80365.1 MAG: M24 family metallopeptidase [Mesorhizobium sp.]
MPAFTTEEYRVRVAGLRRKMAERGMDALLVLEEANLNYLTGYAGYSAYVPQAALVLQDDEDPWLIMRELDIHGASVEAYLPESRILSYAEKFIGSKTLSAWQPIGEYVRERVKSSRIGLEFSGGMSRTLGVKDYAVLSKTLGVGKFIDADGLVSSFKAIKSPAEIKYMEQAGKIADRAMLEAKKLIAVGVRECDVAAAVQHALTSGTPEIPGGHGPISMPNMAIGWPANMCHSKWGDGAYKMNSQTNFEIGAFRHRYVAAVSRSIFLGEPTARSRHVHQACFDGWHAAFETLRPGVKSTDVEQAFRRAFGPYGVRKESRMGYSIGLDWVDGGPSFLEGDETEIQENMTFHMLIGIWEKTDGYIFSETVHVGKDGARSFSSLPRDMFVNQ